MKKVLKSVFAISIVLMYSCNSTPMIGDSKHPFIVNSITTVVDITFKSTGMCIYSGPSSSTDSEVPFCQDPDICLPCRLYQIGDTIKPENMISSDTIKINKN